MASTPQNSKVGEKSSSLPGIFAMTAALLFLISAAILADARAESPTGPLKVVTTTGMIADLVSHVGQDRVTADALMGAGVDPHLYKATLTDLQRLEGAEMIFYNGLHLEGKMADVLEKFAKKKPCFAVASEIDPSKLRKPPEFEGQFDPHIWFDVQLWIEALKKVTAELIKQRPDLKDFFTHNSTQYEKELRELHTWIGKEIGSVPKEQRVLITAHDAFGYFGKAYDIEVMGLQGISTASEFGLHDLTQLVDVIMLRKVKAVFVESSVPQKFVLALKEGVAARGGSVALGGELYSDAMGTQGTPEANYIGMIKHNVNLIAQALR